MVRALVARSEATSSSQACMSTTKVGFDLCCVLIAHLFFSARFCSLCASDVDVLF
jgi:hypothetical protein